MPLLARRCEPARCSLAWCLGWCAALAVAFEGKALPEITGELLRANAANGGGSATSTRPVKISPDSTAVRFEPRSASLMHQRTCVPRWIEVDVINQGDEALTLEGVVSEHGSFYPTLRSAGPLEKGKVARLLILFLTQVAGTFDGQVLLQTNKGAIPYHVQATATDNPYRVEPVVGAKVVVGERFTPGITIFNPHEAELRVREVNATEAFLHLALPGKPLDSAGQKVHAAQPALWTIAPKQSKTIIYVSFLSHATGKFKGYVQVKTDIENLLVPIEIMVTKGGVHVTPELVDFQTLVSPLQSRSMWLTLTNLNPRPIELLSLHDPKQDPNLQITGFDQKGLNVMPGATVRFAKVTYHGGDEGAMQGKLQLIINDTDAVSATLDIPYKARVLFGSLGFMNDKTKFQSTPGKVTSTLRSIMISNNFSVPIVVYTARIDDPSFQISHFTPNSLLQPGDAVSLMLVEFTSNGTHALYTRDLELATNVTAMKIPLQVYHGKLHCQVEHGDVKECSDSNLDLNMGIISVTESRKKHINVTNLNPVNVTIEKIACTHSSVNLHIEGMFGPDGAQVQGPGPALDKQGKRMLTMPPGHRLTLSVEVIASDAGASSAVVTISTRRKEHIALTVRYESVLGNLAFLPSKVRFEASFPGRVQSRIVAARSTFERPLKIESVRSTDSRIIPELLTRSLKPLARTEIAYIHYDPSKTTSPDASYMPHADEVEWDVPLTEDVVERWSRRQRVWEEIGSKGQTQIEATLLFDTNIVRDAPVTVTAFLTKPSIVRESSLSFDLTQVGTSVSQMLLVHNPSDTILAVQLVFPLCDALAEGNGTCDVGFNLAKEAQQVFYVKPRADLHVGPIVFEPQQHTAYNTTLYVRNNLTALHPVKLNGIGGSGRLIFRDGAMDFNLTEDDLGAQVLGDESRTYRRRRVAISKSFTATNDCELPVEVKAFDINGVIGCAGFGFEILDCKPFTVAPHESIELSVSFTPDFAASRWEQRLRLHTQSGVLAVPLRAFVPPELLPQLADRAPFMGDSEDSARKVVTAISMTLCGVMLVVVAGDIVKVYKGTGNGTCRDNAVRPAEMISLLSWPNINALAPTMWGSDSIRRNQQALGHQRAARRDRRDEQDAIEHQQHLEHQQHQQQQQAQRQQEHQLQQQQQQAQRQHEQHLQAQRQGQAGGSVPSPQGSSAASVSGSGSGSAGSASSVGGAAAGAAAGTSAAASSTAQGQQESAARRAGQQRAVEDTKAKAAEEAQRKANAEEAERRLRAEEEQRRRAREAEEERQIKVALEESRKVEEARRKHAEKEAQAQARQAAAAKAEAVAAAKQPPKAKPEALPKGKAKASLPPASQAQPPAPTMSPTSSPGQKDKVEAGDKAPPRPKASGLPSAEKAASSRDDREPRPAAAAPSSASMALATREEWQQVREDRGGDARPGAASRGGGAPAAGAAASAETVTSPKRKEAQKRKESAAFAKAKSASAGQQASPQAGGRGASGVGKSASSSGATKSVWADPKPPAYQPQSHWVTGDVGARGSSLGGLPPPPGGMMAEDLSGGPPNAKMPLPPPPSMPPPPAPRVPKAAGGGAASSAAAALMAPVSEADLVPPLGSFLGMDRGNVPVVAPIGPASVKMQRPAANLLPDQEFIPINTDSPSLDRMQVFGESPFASSLFSPFAMFGPVTSYGGGVDALGAPSGSGLLADLNADSQVVEHTSQRRKSETLWDTGF